MTDQRLELLYERFTQRGDVAALAEVFDRTAPELRQLARRLVSDSHAADDLVQEAFLTAIERPESFDPKRPLGPWLVGILVNRAREARRREARVLEPERLHTRDTHPPDREAAWREHEEAVEAAVRELPHSLRVVVEAKLAGTDSRSLATQLGISYGAVRTRLARGLERVRRILPPGLASLFAVVFLHSQGLARVRVRVLDSASRHPLAHGAGGLVSGLGIGSAILMKKLTVVTGLIVLALASTLYVVNLEPPAEPSDAQLTSKSPPTPALASGSLTKPGLARVTPDLGHGTDADGRTAVPSNPTQSTEGVTVLGRVVEENGRALPGALVSLSAYKQWAPGAGAEPLTGKLVGWTTLTDADGGFRFEVPEPTGKRARLTIEPDPFHEALRLTFGQEPFDDEPALTAGVRDMGLVKLGPAGAIEGTVVDPGGQPIPGARLFLSTKGYDTLGHDTVTDALGRWTMSHVSPGVFGVSVRAPESLDTFHPEIEVLPGHTTGPVEVLLKPAERLEGRVLTPGGQALSGAEVTAWPLTPDATGTTAPSFANSGADGRFTVFLKQQGLHQLSAELAGYVQVAPAPEEGSESPGSRDITLTLEALPTVMFRVVDGVSGEPITSFGLSTQISPPERAVTLYHASNAEPSPEEHPDGVERARARNGLDRVTITAPGYVTAERLVALDADNTGLGGTGIMTVKLQPRDPASRPPRLFGRVVSSGKPLAGAQITLLPGRPLDAPAGGEASFVLNFGTPLSTSTDAAGRFMFDDAQPTSYSLRVRTASGLGVKRDNVLGPWRKDVDLGDLEVEATASLRGHLILPPDVSPSGLTVFLDGEASRIKTLSNEHGEFHLEGVLPGKHLLFTEEIPGKLDGGDGLALDLQPGASREIELDLRGLGLVRVELVLTLNGEPLPDAKVHLHRFFAQDPTNSPLSTRLGELASDAEGRIAGYVQALGRVWIEVEAPQGGSLIAEERLDLKPGRNVETRLNLTRSSLALRLPPEVEAPKAGFLRIALTPLGDQGPGAVLFADIDEDTTPTEFDIGTVSPGYFHLTWTLTERRNRSTDDILAGISPFAEVASGSEDITINPQPTTINLKR